MKYQHRAAIFPREKVSFRVFAYSMRLEVSAVSQPI